MEFRTAGEGDVTASPPLKATNVTAMVLLVSAATGFTTIVAAEPVPVSALQVSVTEAGVAVNELAACAPPQQSATASAARRPAERSVREVESFIEDRFLARFSTALPERPPRRIALDTDRRRQALLESALAVASMGRLAHHAGSARTGPRRASRHAAERVGQPVHKGPRRPLPELPLNAASGQACRAFCVALYTAPRTLPGRYEPEEMGNPEFGARSRGDTEATRRRGRGNSPPSREEEEIKTRTHQGAQIAPHNMRHEVVSGSLSSHQTSRHPCLARPPLPVPVATPGRSLEQPEVA